MSKFFNKKRSGLKISAPLSFEVGQPQQQSPTILISPIVTKPGRHFHDSMETNGDNQNEDSNNARSNHFNAIILIAKYEFQAHNSKELTVSYNEPLKLISRQGNGWLLVKPIGRLGGPGLVPSAYCSVVQTNVPLTEDWLNGSDLNVEEQVQEQKQDQEQYEEEPKVRSASNASESSGTTNSSTADFMDNSCATDSPASLSSIEENVSSVSFLRSVSVKTVSSHKGRYWYRTDALMSEGKTRCLCRYYQDFYSLHAALYDKLFESELRKALPNLPGPIPRPDPEVLLQRCHDLNSYLQKIRVFFLTGWDQQEGQQQEAALEVFKDFLKLRDGDVELDENDYTATRTEEINGLIEPVSPIACKGQFPNATRQENRLVKGSCTSAPIPLSMPADFKPPSKLDVVNIDLLESAAASPLSSPLTASVEAFEPHSPTEQQNEEETGSEEADSKVKSSPETPKKVSKAEKTAEYSPTSPLFHNNKPKMDFINERRSQSPVTSSFENYIRVKVIYNEGKDIIAMKMLKDSNLTILKLSISSKTQIFDYVLSYKDVKSGFFKPLRSNKDLQDAVNKNKIVIKVTEVGNVLV